MTPSSVVRVQDHGFQEAVECSVTYGWIVKREKLRDADAEAAE